ncbi:IS1595 family transposase [Phenylobacterium zucineum]|nr:IS1595 family transposase [Phenylobacterium zucineum]
MTRFATDEAARAYLEAVRWPEGPVCPHCGNADAARVYEIAANPAKKVRAGLRECKECGKQFTVTVGTIFEDSKIPLRKWLVAWYMLCSSKKGISALQMQRMLELGSYRSAWFMMHRIRFALREPAFTDKLGGGGGTVEADETYVGGRETNKPLAKRKRGQIGGVGKQVVFTLVERGGRARSFRVPNVTGKTLDPILRAHVSSDATLMTDEAGQYRNIGKEFAAHETVNHGKDEYVRGKAHSNTVEGYFSLFKRGLNGTFHHIGPQYLNQYLAEFDFRYNHRDISDGARTREGLKKVRGKRLMLHRAAPRP